MSASPVPPGAPLDLDAIEARANASTDSPWAFAATADAHFIAHARTDVPALCAEIRRLRSALEDAYREGWGDAERWHDTHRVAADCEVNVGWNESGSRAALAPTGTPAGGDADA